MARTRGSKRDSPERCHIPPCQASLFRPSLAPLLSTAKSGGITRGRCARNRGDTPKNAPKSGKNVGLSAATATDVAYRII